MTIPNPDHLFEQGGAVSLRRGARQPRQVDLRRAISAAYYAIFHFSLAAASDELIGVTMRTTIRYTLIYRSIDHRTLKDLCVEVGKSKPSSRYRPYVPHGGFCTEVKAFADVAIELQEKRHAADYAPQAHFEISDAHVAITLGRGAVQTFRAADPDHRKTFLTLLVIEPR